MTSLHFGRTTSGRHRLGALQCRGRARPPHQAASCSDLRLLGHRHDAFYVVRVDGVLRTVYCHMDYETGRFTELYRVVPSFWAEMEEPFAEVQRMLLSQLMTCCVVLLQTWNRWSRSVRQFTSTWRCCTEFRHRKWIALFDSQNCNVRDDSVDRRSVSIFASSRSATT